MAGRFPRRQITERRYTYRQVGGNGYDSERFMVEERRTYSTGQCQSFVVMYVTTEREAREITEARNANA